MKVADFMGSVQRRGKATTRHLTTYRAARRNIAKISYRRAKRGRALMKGSE